MRRSYIRFKKHRSVTRGESVMTKKMTKTRIILTIVMLSLAMIVFLQNTQEVETKLLFTTITMPRVLLLLLTFTLGLIVGLITTGLFRKE